MAQNIISERWTVYAASANPLLPAGRFGSPIISEREFCASGCMLSPGPIFPNTIFDLPNAFNEADSVLVRRLRVWSPLCGLGLVGGAALNSLISPIPNELSVYAFRAGSTVNPTGKVVNIFNGLVLGEWVDVNQSLDSVGIDGSGNWQIKCSASSILLDSSRVASDVIGSATLNFHVQMDIAHTLQAIHI